MAHGWKGYTAAVAFSWKLLADGQCTVGFGTFPYEAEYKPYFASPGHPAAFVFGRNSGETPEYGDTYEYTLYPDETLYILRCEVYDKAGKNRRSVR